MKQLLIILLTLISFNVNAQQIDSITNVPMIKTLYGVKAIASTTSTEGDTIFNAIFFVKTNNRGSKNPTVTNDEGVIKEQKIKGKVTFGFIGDMSKADRILLYIIKNQSIDNL
jgi:hypothetical protein